MLHFVQSMPDTDRRRWRSSIVACSTGNCFRVSGTISLTPIFLLIKSRRSYRSHWRKRLYMISKQRQSTFEAGRKDVSLSWSLELSHPLKGSNPKRQIRTAVERPRYRSGTEPVIFQYSRSGPLKLISSKLGHQQATPAQPLWPIQIRMQNTYMVVHT